MIDRRRIIWPEGEYEKAVVTSGWADRLWKQFRMGWAIRPSKLKRVMTATDLPEFDYRYPRLAARRWERLLGMRR